MEKNCEMTPLAKERVPEVGVKSEEEVAVPPEVA